MIMNEPRMTIMSCPLCERLLYSRMAHDRLNGDLEILECHYNRSVVMRSALEVNIHFTRKIYQNHSWEMYSFYGAMYTITVDMHGQGIFLCRYGKQIEFPTLEASRQPVVERYRKLQNMV